MSTDLESSKSSSSNSSYTAHVGNVSVVSPVRLFIQCVTVPSTDISADQPAGRLTALPPKKLASGDLATPGLRSRDSIITSSSELSMSPLNSCLSSATGAKLASGDLAAPGLRSRDSIITSPSELSMSPLNSCLSSATGAEADCCGCCRAVALRRGAACGAPHHFPDGLPAFCGRLCATDLGCLVLGAAPARTAECCGTSNVVSPVQSQAVHSAGQNRPEAWR